MNNTINDALASVHNRLLTESAMYREAYKLGLAGLMTDMQVREIERSALQKEMIMYTIKPLLWECWRDNEEGRWFRAETVFGGIDVFQEQDGSCRWGYCFNEYCDQDQHSCNSVEEGKATAEKYYQERLLPALQPG